MSKKILYLNEKTDKDAEAFKAWCALFSQSFIAESLMKKHTEKNNPIRKHGSAIGKGRKAANS